MDIEQQIKRAIEEGKFNNLPGAGKPLNLYENPFEDPSWRLANKILKDNGFSPAWIETRKEIEVELRAAREMIRIAREVCLDAGGGSTGSEAQAHWTAAKQEFLDRIGKTNQMIFRYNIQAPTIQVQLRALNAMDELEKAIQTGDGDVSSTLP
jgi:DnaJ family protein C protein 28